LKPYKKFLRNFVSISAGVSILVAIFCIIADPYEIWHIYSHQGVNLYSVKGENIERLTKPLNFMLHHKDAQTVILGSSRADYALNPATWENLTGNKTYNFAITSATIHENFHYLNYVISDNKNLKEVIFCVDFFAFIDNPEQHFLKILPIFEADKAGKFLPTLQNFQKILFSWDAVKDSYKNFEKNSVENLNFPCHDFNGKFSEGYISYHYEYNDSKFFDVFNMWNEKIDFSTISILDDALKDFQSSVELCKKNNIKLYICILPLYPLHYDCFNPCWNVYDDWKIKLASIFPIYDFTCFDENLMRKENFWDTSHTKLIIGDKILNSIHSGNLEFGEIITPENVQKHNEEITRQREIWRSKNLNK
jgi:hypothetical protein